MAAAAVTQLPAAAATAQSAAAMPAVTTQPLAEQLPAATMPLPAQLPSGNGQPALEAQPPQLAAPAVPPAGLTYEAAVERVEGFLRRLAVEHDKEGFFQEKVSTSLRGCENYYERIKHPMWFSRIREKLRGREYRTLHQLQADIELICSNATTFNQKQSRVYKNAQSMLKGCRKQLPLEKPLLREALFVLHPQGPEAAQAEEAAEQQALAAMLPPPKKVLQKATKPPKKPPSNTAGGLQRAAMPSALIPGAEYVHLLGMGGEIEDLLVDVAADREERYSSFSDTDDEGGDGRVSKPDLLADMGSVAEAQAWQEAPPATGASAQSAAAASGRSNAWKTRRRGVEWRIRWLEHRLRELHHQQRRYEERLERLQDAAAATSAAEAAPPPPQTAQVEEGQQESREGPEGVRLRQRGSRTVQQLGGEHLLDYPFFAAQAGLRRNKQIVRDAEELQSVEEGEDFPAVAYATLEQLERQMLGLRRQLCQPGLGPGAARRSFAPTPAVAAAPPRGKVRAAAAKPSREGKASKRVRRSTDSGSDFILPGAAQGFQRVKGVKITVPQYHEHSAEELRSRAAILRRIEEQEARRAASERDASAERSSSSEDTDDEAFGRIHAVMEEQERTMYAGWSGGAQRQKRDKTAAKEGQDAAVVAVAAATASGRDTNGGVSMEVEAVLSAGEDEIRMRGGRDGGRRGRGLSISVSRGRGRSRARGRPPGPGRHQGSARNASLKALSTSPGV